MSPQELALLKQHGIKIEEQKFTKPWWWNDITNGNNGDVTIRKIVRAFVLDDFKGKMTAYGGRHIYTVKNDELWLFKNNESIKARICVAKKIGDYFVGNSSSLTILRTKDGKRVWTTGGRFRIQAILVEVMPMVPFRMFKEAKLDLNSMRVIDKSSDEEVDVGWTNNGEKVLTHFTGSLLFKIRPKSEAHGIKDRYFLFDIDRNDLALKRFSPFLSRLPEEANSIEEAYDMLKPQEVKDAERFMDKECPRHGEWFFIPAPKSDYKRKKLSNWWNGRSKLQYAEAILQVNGNRSHVCSELSEEGLVKGLVKHEGHDHAPIELKEWHRPVPNTAVESFQISGSID